MSSRIKRWSSTTTIEIGGSDEFGSPDLRVEAGVDGLHGKGFFRFTRRVCLGCGRTSITTYGYGHNSSHGRQSVRTTPMLPRRAVATDTSPRSWREGVTAANTLPLAQYRSNHSCPEQ